MFFSRREPRMAMSISTRLIILEPVGKEYLLYEVEL